MPQPPIIPSIQQDIEAWIAEVPIDENILEYVLDNGEEARDLIIRAKLLMKQVLTYQQHATNP